MPILLRESRLINPNHDRHYGTLILLAWAAAGALTLPLIAHASPADSLWPALLLAAPPVLGHVYSLRAVLPVRAFADLRAHMLAALMTLSYGLAVLVCLGFEDPANALFLPAAGIYMAMMSFGLFFPGLALPLAYFINAKWVQPHRSSVRLAFATTLFVAAWSFSGFAAYVISHV